MSLTQRLNAYLWPDTLRDIHQHLFNPDPVKQQSLKHYRIIAVMLFIGIYCHSYFAFEGARLYYLIAFTQWGLFLTALEFVFLVAASCARVETKSGQRVCRLAYVFFEIAWTAEVVITIVFWSILVVVDFEKAQDYDLEVLIFMCESHLMPITLLSIDFYHNQMRFSKSHAILVAIPPTLYTGVSIFFSLVYDIHAYPILTWKDYKSIIFGLLIAALFAGGFMSGYFLGETKYKRRMRRLNQMAKQGEGPNDGLLSINTITDPTL